MKVRKPKNKENKSQPKQNGKKKKKGLCSFVLTFQLSNSDLMNVMNFLYISTAYKYQEVINSIGKRRRVSPKMAVGTKGSAHNPHNKWRGWRRRESCSK